MKQKLEAVEVMLYQYMHTDGETSFTPNKRMKEYLYGTVEVGQVTALVIPLPNPTKSQQIKMQVSDLNEELTNCRAASFMQEQAIKDKIQKLLCITDEMAAIKREDNIEHDDDLPF